MHADMAVSTHSANLVNIKAEITCLLLSFRTKEEHCKVLFFSEVVLFWDPKGPILVHYQYNGTKASNGIYSGMLQHFLRTIT
jgi:hypothetical protein